ncbi:DEAD/DEAH box helicase [Tropicimonas sp. TH_r6]|uniref:DEAD/DEAH box helicase n=1 Tax=Tropicimonas sp. TH_r6 TaxID=3082085 RepID=UPI0029552BC1|nr:DEAD/DEAH box helicase [Tropicimonas sp. TH_r6]MDV7144764.1 DEAD/DEAH box helicase [Tropicimonas sp. TH_r6]
MAKFPLRTIRNSDFFDLYRKLMDRKELSNEEKEALLSIAVMLLNEPEEHSVMLGYRIIVMYSNHTSDLKPLYDVSLSRGFMPIVQRASTENLLDEAKEHFFPNYFSALMSQYEVDGTVFTEQQIELGTFFKENDDQDVLIVAPTSYGKSELISKYSNRNLDQNICILVPTKALLAQTKQRILSGMPPEDIRRVITHAEMYHGGETRIIAVLTQERLLRFFTEHPYFRFDTVFVDEAHNLLGDGQRELLLAKVVILQKQKSPSSAIKFLTPFLANEENIRPRYTDITPTSYRVRENLKSERYSIADFRSGKMKTYDQYFDRFWELTDKLAPTEEAFIVERSARKNIIFFNLPKRIELFATNLTPQLPVVESSALERACRNIAEFLHSDYLLVEALRKGVLYHHGAVPDIVRLYAERAFSEIDCIRYIICNSTLLEGVNIPAEKIFLLETKKGLRNLTQPQFRNLVGRVCRFSEIFDAESGDLKLLEPEVVVFNSDRFSPANANVEEFLRGVTKVDAKLKEPTENVLLDAKAIDDEDVEEKREADEFLEAMSPGITGNDVARPSTEVGRACLLNNISEIDVLRHEAAMQEILNGFVVPLATSNLILELVSIAFVPYFKEHRAFDVVRRLEEENARKFYAMLIDWRINNASFSEMIANFLRYWKESDVDEVYVGRWGEIAREGSHRESWVRINEKSHSQRVNLAIVRIKEEQDIVDNHVLKFVEVLNDLKKIPERLYLEIKYGTTNLEKIRLINNGFNSALAGRLIDSYGTYVEESEGDEAITLQPELIEKMRDEGENEILVFEAALHMGIRHEFID